jgi:hypothetical protein
VRCPPIFILRIFDDYIRSQHFQINAKGTKGGWFGWPEDANMEELRDAFVRVNRKEYTDRPVKRDRNPNRVGDRQKDRANQLRDEYFR